jgi:hypothetical protein
MSEIANIIIIAVAILGIVIPVSVAIVIYLKQRPRKVISFQKITEERLLSVSNELRDKLKIFYEDKLVEGVNLFKFEFSNSGNREILEKDYVKPISLFFGDNAHVLSVEITEIKPKSFEVSALTDGKVINLSKCVFNAGESITVKTLVSKPQFYSINGRIAGGKIEEFIPTTKKPDFWWKAGILVIFVSILGMFTSFGFNQLALGGLFFLMFAGVAVMVAIIFVAQFYVFISSRLHNRKNNIRT